MKIEVNGQAREIDSGATVADLLDELGLKSELVAVERNLEIVPRIVHATTTVEDGDTFEIVTLVGGG